MVPSRAERRYTIHQIKAERLRQMLYLDGKTSVGHLSQHLQSLIHAHLVFDFGELEDVVKNEAVEEVYNETCRLQ